MIKPQAVCPTTIERMITQLKRWSALKAVTCRPQEPRGGPLCGESMVSCDIPLTAGDSRRTMWPWLRLQRTLFRRFVYLLTHCTFSERRATQCKLRSTMGTTNSAYIAKIGFVQAPKLINETMRPIPINKMAAQQNRNHAVCRSRLGVMNASMAPNTTRYQLLRAERNQR